MAELVRYGVLPNPYTPGILVDFYGNPIVGVTGVSSFNTRTGAVVPATGDYTAAQVTGAADKSNASTQVFTGTISTPAIASELFQASGAPGITGVAGLIGGLASGSPSSGTFTAGTFIVNADASIWVCTAAGTPGTWVQVPGLPGVAIATPVANVSTGETSYLQLTLPANAAAAKTTWEIVGYYVFSGPADTNVSFKVRIGTTTLTGAIAATQSVSSGTFTHGMFRSIITVQTAGTGGTVAGNTQFTDAGAGVTGSTPAAAVAINTTIANILEFTCKASVAGPAVCTMEQLVIKQVV